jgi:hypothetical protein
MIAVKLCWKLYTNLNSSLTLWQYFVLNVLKAIKVRTKCHQNVNVSQYVSACYFTKISKLKIKHEWMFLLGVSELNTVTTKWIWAVLWTLQYFAVKFNWTYKFIYGNSQVYVVVKLVKLWNHRILWNYTLKLCNECV